MKPPISATGMAKISDVCNPISFRFCVLPFCDVFDLPFCDIFLSKREKMEMLLISILLVESVCFSQDHYNWVCFDKHVSIFWPSDIYFSYSLNKCLVIWGLWGQQTFFFLSHLGKCTRYNWSTNSRSNWDRDTKIDVNVFISTDIQDVQ